MAEETTPQSMTTVLSKTEITLEQLNATGIKNLLYLIHGTGSGRDMTLDLDVLKQWLDSTSGPIHIAGQNGTVDITNTKVNVAGPNDTEVEVTGDEIKFIYHLSAQAQQIMLTLTKDGITVPSSVGTVTIENGNVKVTKSGDSVTIDKDGVVVESGDYTASLKKDEVKVSRDMGASGVRETSLLPNSVTVEDEDGNTTIVGSSYVNTNSFLTNFGARKYSKVLDNADTLASAVKSTLEGVNSVFVLSEGSASAPNLYLDHTGIADGYVIAVDWQAPNGTVLTVLNGNTTNNNSLCYMAANTVRKFRYVAGLNAHWENLY